MYLNFRFQEMNLPLDFLKVTGIILEKLLN
jgi:hypothetical protein